MGIKIKNELMFKQFLKNGINIFAGSGFSKLADKKGNVLPDADELCDEIRRIFDVDKEKKYDLEQISNIITLRCKNEFQQYLRNKFTVNDYNPLYDELNRMNIKSFITTNIDNIIQCTMENSERYYLHHILKYGATKKTEMCIPYLPLHGDVADINCNLYFGKSELVNVDGINKELFNSMYQKLLENPTLFWGYGFHDNAIERYITNILEKKPKPIWIQCYPGSKNIDYLRDLGCYIIEATTEELLEWIKNNIDLCEKEDSSVFPKNLEMYQVPTNPQIVSREEYFTEGLTDWYPILYKYPYETKNVDEINELSLRNKNLIVIGIPFSGKTTLMMQLSAKMEDRIKLVLRELSVSTAEFIVRNLRDITATIFVDDCCDDVDGIAYLMKQSNLRVIGFCDDFMFESTKHILDDVEYEKIFFSEISLEEAQKIYQTIPPANRMKKFAYKEVDNEKYSMFELISKNVKGVLSLNRVSITLGKVRDSSYQAFEIIALTTYLSYNKSVISMDVLFSYFNTTDYKKIKKLLDTVSGFLNDLSIDLNPDTYDQDYYELRSKLFINYSMYSLNNKYKNDFKKIVRTFVFRVSPIKVYKNYIFKRTAFDSKFFFKLFYKDADEIYQALYNYDESPYTLQQWALYKAHLGDYSTAFNYIDKAISRYSSNFSIKNTRAIILFEANKGIKNEQALNGMKEAMITLTECYDSDKRKIYHAKKYAEFAIYLVEEYQNYDYLEIANDWMEKIHPNGENNYLSTQKLKEKIKTLLKCD